jgi:hypothetical protein
MEVDGESYKSWAWWLDALQAMRRTYSIPMDTNEARIQAEVAEARRKETAAAAALRLEAMREGRLLRWICMTQDPKSLRAAAEEARREDLQSDEQVVVRKWAKTKDPEGVTYQKQLDDERMQMHRRMTTEEYFDREDWSEPCNYRNTWNYLHAHRRGITYEDTSK